MRGIIPNAFTMGNLICGCLAIWSIYKAESFSMAAIFIGLAAIFDLFDGFLARLLKVAGPLGKQLDSLADAVSFGMAPAFMVIVLMSDNGSDELGKLVYFSPLLLAVASIYRLGKFNIDERQGDRFLGLPTPSNALFWVSICMLYDSGTLSSHWFNPWILISLIIGMSVWMISETPLLALKFKNFGFRGNRSRYLLIALGVLTLTSAKALVNSFFAAVPIVLLLYLVISLWDYQIKKNHEVSR